MPSLLPLQNHSLLYTITLLTSLGFLLIGYDNGLMGGLITTPSFLTTFKYPSPTITGLIVSIYELGAFLGSVLTSLFSEPIGRRRTIGNGVVIMVLGAVLQSSSYSLAQMLVGRVRADQNISVVVCMLLTTLNLGIFLAYWIDYAFTQTYTSPTSTISWRMPIILQCIFLLPMLLLLLIIPESPRWLAAHSHPQKSLEVLTRLYSSRKSSSEINALHQQIVKTVEAETSFNTGSWRDLLHNDEIQSQRRLLIACAIQSFQQLGGINALIYYSTTLFSTSLNFSPHLASLMSGFLQTWLFVASFIPWFLLDRVGRRPLLLSMIGLMSAIMAVQTGLIYNVENQTSIARSCGIAAAVMLFLFEGAFTIGFQATVWVYPSEILPLRLRQRGSAVSTACNWIFNYMVVQVTPVALHNIGYRTYIIFAVLNAVWVPIIYLFFPETKGLELEEVDSLFAKHEFVREGLVAVVGSSVSRSHESWEDEGESGQGRLEGNGKR
ncbi:hypothetical protein G7Y89_g15303 [Cudoniella acicularis]|uniref:Major facilitator superfamily (MFS) profile domain-containing protein n=1 Tax=Cudoniella acicularis TaxID=354080 RepID=A0A8H4QRI2_9HELO|nr:hypothetical protein G7Y89_g15303 [Cudoniella acicularis]